MSLSAWFQNSLGFRGRNNLLAWVVAGSLAYAFYVVPERRRAQEQHAARELARKLAAEKGLTEEIDRTRPIPDPQDTGLIKGNASKKSV